jgi:hypothetical protein
MNPVPECSSRIPDPHFFPSRVRKKASDFGSATLDKSTLTRLNLKKERKFENHLFSS